VLSYYFVLPRAAGPAADKRQGLKVPVFDIRTIEDFYQTKVVDIAGVSTEIVGAMRPPQGAGR
jgi:hypothetical protein